MNGSTPDMTGRTVRSITGRSYKLVGITGFGGQGVVYDEPSGRMLIKLYHPGGSQAAESDRLRRLRFIRDLHMPKYFVGVEDIISEPLLGYVMKKVEGHVPLDTYLIPNRIVSFSEWYNKGRGLRDRLFLGFVIAKAFGELEGQNLSYCDISGSNILVKVDRNVSVRIIDVDNIYVAGTTSAAILGTPRYIAPEVLTRDKNPDVLSDNYSLAVILHELLRAGHPYIGDDVADGTPEDEEDAFAGNRDYVSDANSSSMLPADVVFTERLRSLFEQCFTAGKRNRMVRPSAQDFQIALLDASNKLVQCPSCGAWHYPRKYGKDFACCPWCDSPSGQNAWLIFSKQLSGTNRGTRPIASSRSANTYILREGKNRIKGFYLVADLTRDHTNSLLENLFTIAKNSQGYWAFNEYDRKGAGIIKHATRKRVPLGKHKYELLENGDLIYFGEPTHASIGGDSVTLNMVAKFYEAVQ